MSPKYDHTVSVPEGSKGPWKIERFTIDRGAASLMGLMDGGRYPGACCPDRNQTCGKCLRGLLCGKCNRAAGLAKDSPEVLRGLADYLDSWKGNQ